MTDDDEARDTLAYQPHHDDPSAHRDCEDAIRRAYEYLDGELTMWRRVAITRHLDDCPPCADGFTFELELRRVVVSKCHEEVPAELRARIAAALGLDLPGTGLPLD